MAPAQRSQQPQALASTPRHTVMPSPTPRRRAPRRAVAGGDQALRCRREHRSTARQLAGRALQRIAAPATLGARRGHAERRRRFKKATARAASAVMAPGLVRSLPGTPQPQEPSSPLRSPLPPLVPLVEPEAPELPLLPPFPALPPAEELPPDAAAPADPAEPLAPELPAVPPVPVTHWPMLESVDVQASSMGHPLPPSPRQPGTHVWVLVVSQTIPLSCAPQSESLKQPQWTVLPEPATH